MVKTCKRCGQSKAFGQFNQVATRTGKKYARNVCKKCQHARPPALVDGPALRAFEREVDAGYAALGAVPVEIDDAPTGKTFDTSDVVIEVADPITVVQEHRLKIKVRELEADKKRLIAELSDAQEYNDISTAAIDARGMAATIAPRERTSGLREATALVLASDWHIEEQVLPEQVQYRNRYNLEISARRMERFFQAARWATEHERQAFTIRDMVLWLGGDLITGYLHDDNRESNLLAPVDAISYAFNSVSAGIKFLLEDPQLERLIVPCNDGNHGRLTKDLRAATRTQNSLETMLYRHLQTAFANEPRIEFKIAASPRLYMDIYGRSVCFTHGDTVNYGGGVGGITIPINKAIARWETVQHADLVCMGHWHQYTQLRNLIINGSLIGYNTYAMKIGAPFEPPAQAFTILEPRRFNSVSMPLWVSDVEDDAQSEAA